MCEVSKLLTIRNPRKLSLKKKLKKRLNTEFPMLRENWTTFSITINNYFLPLQSNFFCKIEGCFTLHLAKFRGNWPSSSGDKNYNVRHMAFLHKYRKWRIIWMCVFTIVIDWVFSRILTQMIKFFFYSYMGPCLLPIKYGTTHDNYLKSYAWNIIFWISTILSSRNVGEVSAMWCLFYFTYSGDFANVRDTEHCDN